MKYFPAFVALAGKRTLIAGSCDGAGLQMLLQKTRLFLKAGALIDIVVAEDSPFGNEGSGGGDGLPADKLRVSRDDVADRILAGLEGEYDPRAIEGQVRPIRFDQVAENLRDYRLVVAASGIAAFDAHIAQLGRDAGKLVNVVDQQEACDYITPSIVDRGDVVVAVSSAGTSPVLARRIREQIERLLPERIGSLARFASLFRPLIKNRVDAEARRTFWERFFDSPLADDILRGSEPTGSQMSAFIDSYSRETAQGKVFIVGTGPGDPELLTLKALRVMQRADIVFYDKLVGREIFDYVRRDAERVYVGKTRACHSMAQDEIHRRMAEAAKSGRTVVRLKGGDPFVFGRGGEELAFMRSQGVAFEVVPGITAALGCAAAVGIPLTHRDHAHAVTFVTGHGKTESDDVDWTALAELRQTLVFYMGVQRAGHISRSLIDAGLARATPVALIENGTLPSQRLLRGELWELPAMIEDNAVQGPAVIVVGEVARLGAAEIVTLQQNLPADRAVRLSAEDSASRATA